MILESLFVRLAWPFNFALCLLFFHEIWTHRQTLLPYIARSRYVALSALILTVVVVATVDQYLRIHADETNLINTSRQMMFRHEAMNTIDGQSNYGRYDALSVLIPKRPTLYAFFLSIWQTIFGVSAYAGIYLNNVVLFFLLYLIGFVAYGGFGLPGSIGMQLLLLSQPVVALHASSGGFDLFAAFWLILSLFLCHTFMAVNTISVFRMLALALTMLCWSRYESVGYAALIVVLLTFFGFVPISFVKRSWKLLATLGFLFSLTLVQKAVSVGGYEQPKGEPLFGLQHFLVNAPIFIKNLWVYDYRQPFNPALMLFGVVALPWFSFSFVRRRFRSKLHGKYLFLVSCVTIFNLLLMLFHCDAEITNPVQTRYFMIFAIVSVGLLLSVFYRLNANPKAIFLMGLVSFLMFHPIAIEDRIFSNIAFTREARFYEKFAKEHMTEKSLAVADRPGIFVAHGYSAVQFVFVNSNIGVRAKIVNGRRRHAFDKVYVFQHVNYMMGLNPLHHIDGWKLREVATLNLDDKEKLVVMELEVDE